MPDRDDLWSNGAAGIPTPTTLQNALQGRATPGVLYGIDGWTDEAATVYVCIFDSAAAVANGNPPVPWPKHIIEIDKPGNGNFGTAIPPTGEYYYNGIWVAVSTTKLPNFTLSTNSKTSFNIQTSPEFGGGNP